MPAIDVIRSVKFCRDHENDPRFYLSIWDTHRTNHRGCTILGYELYAIPENADMYTVFKGEDFAGSPLHADDSDATALALMTFLTLRPGDTDSEYFASYSQVQLDFVAHHAEYLAYQADLRFGE